MLTAKDLPEGWHRFRANDKPDEWFYEQINNPKHRISTGLSSYDRADHPEGWYCVEHYVYRNNSGSGGWEYIASFPTEAEAINYVVVRALVGEW